MQQTHLPENSLQNEAMKLSLNYRYIFITLVSYSYDVFGELFEVLQKVNINTSR